MLYSLHVKNLALVEEAEVQFTNDFNVMTGETGAGKSIIIGSIILALGGKASPDMIRTGAQYALCELLFHIEEKEKLEALKRLGIEELEEGNLLISRKIGPLRSFIKVNGASCTVSEVRKIAELLIDIHGQHEHQLLLNESRHLALLDRFLDRHTDGILQAVSRLYGELTALSGELEALEMDEGQRQREISFIEFELNEIDEAHLQPGEDSQLEETFRKMQNGQKIGEELGKAFYLLEEGPESILQNAGSAIRSVSAGMHYDSSLEDIYSGLMDLESLAQDVSRSLERYMQGLEFEEEEFGLVSERLTLINRLKMKYGRELEDIFRYRKEKAAQMEKLLHAAEERLLLAERKKALEEELDNLCQELSKCRKKTAAQLSESVQNALKELNFLQVRFEIEFEKLDNFTGNGRDKVCFLISTNPGEELKPLKAVASGGEMSRILLAIKAVLARKDELDTLIFDEIDAGISGVTAQMVAEKMCDIARTHQVICISHLSQIAALADSHFLIEKHVSNDNTVTSIRKLEREESILELARLLGGNRITQAVMDTAREIKK